MWQLPIYLVCLCDKTSYQWIHLHHFWKWSDEDHCQCVDGTAQTTVLVCSVRNLYTYTCWVPAPQQPTMVFLIITACVVEVLGQTRERLMISLSVSHVTTRSTVIWMAFLIWHLAYEHDLAMYILKCTHCLSLIPQNCSYPHLCSSFWKAWWDQFSIISITQDGSYPFRKIRR